MQYTSVILALAASAVALPNVGPSPKGGELGQGKQQPFWPVNNDVSVEEAKAACGDDNQIACCDDTTLTGDQVEVESGPLAGALKDLLGGKNGAKGLGLFDKCSRLNIDGKLLFICSKNLHTNENSPHRCLGPHQHPVQAEHCLLPGQQRRLLQRPHRSQRSLRGPWLPSVKNSLYFITYHISCLLFHPHVKLLLFTLAMYLRLNVSEKDG